MKTVLILSVTTLSEFFFVVFFCSRHSEMLLSVCRLLQENVEQEGRAHTWQACVAFHAPSVPFVTSQAEY